MRRCALRRFRIYPSWGRPLPLSRLRPPCSRLSRTTRRGPRSIPSSRKCFRYGCFCTCGDRSPSRCDCSTAAAKRRKHSPFFESVQRLARGIYESCPHVVIAHQRVADPSCSTTLSPVGLGQVLNAVLSAGNELEAQEMLESLVQLADISPLFFRTNVVSAVPLRDA